MSIGSKKYQLTESARKYYDLLEYNVDKTEYPHIVNPCGEITLHNKGAYCIISDIVPYFCKSLDRVKEIAALTARFLIRVNLMDSLYYAETKRTNRIGVGITGIHEFAWKEFGYGFKDLVDEEKSKDFWKFIEELRIHTEEAAKDYALEIGVNIPHTVTTIKPSGSVSKLFALTEGAHLPAMRYYLRWVQMQNNDPLLDEYRQKGYPVHEVHSYPNVSRVGFPTLPLISTLGMNDKLVTAAEATPEDQYKYLMLLEKYWLGETNNQVSYTLKIDVDKVSFEDYKDTVFNYQSKIRCCSVMPTQSQEKLKTVYEYLPEEEVSEAEFIAIVSNITDEEMKQEIDITTLLCSSGSCPL